ncbi:MAG: hypothetical protein GY811_24140 [Myxococcales bacterium]|nr:hypothetical protein [Myxococcales bacterium]
MNTPLRSLILSCLLAPLALTACDEAVVGADQAASPPLSLCAQAATTVCAAACDCQGSTQCYTATGSVATSEYDDLEHCVSFSIFTCQGGASSDSAIQACIDASQRSLVRT